MFGRNGGNISNNNTSTRGRCSKLESVFSKLTVTWPKGTGTGAGASVGGDDLVDGHHRQQQQHQVNCCKIMMSSDIIETVLADSPIPVAVCVWETNITENNNSEESSACLALSKRLEAELRAAKSAQLACGEVLLPADLLPRISRAVLSMADSEPCGLRGCTLFVNFEAQSVCRRLSTVKCDPDTVSTFELYLTLKQDATSWHSLLPQFLKNLTRGGTVVISPAFTLSKKKLYRSYQISE